MSKPQTYQVHRKCRCAGIDREAQHRQTMCQVLQGIYDMPASCEIILAHIEISDPADLATIRKYFDLQPSPKPKNKKQ